MIKRVLFAAGVVGALALGAGFAWFVRDAAYRPPPPPAADGIVALTGGADRVAAALRLLQAGSGRYLLISGVDPRAGLASLGRLAHVDPSRLADRITLGHGATDTAGNARETAFWAAGHGVRALIVVTAGYHMRRALLELSRDLPTVTLYRAPVRTRAGWRVLADEYGKFLLAWIGLSRPIGR